MSTITMTPNPDDEILRGIFPSDPGSNVSPLPPGHSYYWDARAEGLDHERAVRRAAREMGTVLSSLQAVGR